MIIKTIRLMSFAVVIASSTLLLSSCTGEAAGITSLEEFKAATAPANEIPTVCGLSFDITKSVSPKLFEAAVSALADQIPGFVETFHCTTVRLTNFGDEAGFATPTEFNFQKKVMKIPATSAAPGQTSGITDHMKQAQELKRQKAEADAQQTATDLAKLRTQFIQEIQNWIRMNVQQEYRSATCFQRFVRSLQDEVAPASIDVLLSDARESCLPEDKNVTQLHHPVVFLLLPSVGDLQQTVPAVDEMTVLLKETFPGCQTARASELVLAAFWPAVKERIDQSGLWNVR